MKLTMSKAVLALLVLGMSTSHHQSLAAKTETLSDRDLEDQEFWRGLAEDTGSFPAPTAPPTSLPTSFPTNAPTLPPVPAPTPPPVPSPTGAPVPSPTAAPPTNPPPTAAPVAAPTLPPPTSAPVAPPTGAPVSAPPVSAPPTDAPVSAIRMRLTPYALNGGAEFDDPDSYQSCALAKVEAQVGAADFTDAKLTQYYSLYSIFCNTNAVPNPITDNDDRFVGIPFPTWLVTTGWEETTLDPCDGWYGIGCDAEGRVNIVDLFENLLTGYFPPEVALMSLDGPSATGGGALFRIDLFRNEFLWNNGDSSWMTDCGSSITTIIAEDTAFTGDIPRLPDNLVNFDVSFAFFTGGLTDANFEGLSEMNFLDLDGNAFNTTVPAVLGSLPNLQFLYLSDAFISGDLSYMSGMAAMREHWIDTNPGLVGTLPALIGDISTLESFSVTFSGLTGPIPTTLGQLENMQQMWLYANQLTGEIPAELGNLMAMRILQVEGNAFVGEMPAEVCANTMFPTQVLEILGADCEDAGFTCTCCTCCSVAQCADA
mmetsp:Transcript_24863/g.59024  ORF Transcript_24863/g.59024 Transcript_24863/m.59024 type:complete len:540 (+) Transcript_24863:526-2145(+)